MSRTTLSVTADGLRVAGITADLDVSGGPLIVALHGGSYTSKYFDVPGHSLLTRGASNGLRVIALDRPCYGRSDALSADSITFERSAKALDTAIGRLWDDYGTHYTGVVLVGHSIGGAICVHIASQAPDWPLLGITISGIHDVTPEQVRNAWDAMPAGQPVEFTPEQRCMFFYGPEWTIESDIVSRADISAAPIPLAELLEVVGRWPDQAAKLAAKITVVGGAVAHGHRPQQRSIPVVTGSPNACLGLGGSEGWCGDGGPAAKAKLDAPEAVATLPGGGFLIADTANNVIREVNPAGVITTVAGDGFAGSADEHGLAVDAELNSPSGVAVLPQGGFLIADTDNNVVREVHPDGRISTIAGTSHDASTGDRGPAGRASLRSPEGLALAPDGSILIAGITIHGSKGLLGPPVVATAPRSRARSRSS
jgi:pimeloyl-ACP methyl ester carboxylesterase